jgi:hypothetical protein
VADTDNYRVLIWNTIPTTHGQAANVVVGQALMTSNAGGTSATILSNPYGVTAVSGKLIVADPVNNRVLIWNSIPTSNGQAANVVLGQTLFTTASANNGGVSASSLNDLQGVFSDGTRLFVSDSANARILVWNTIPTSNKQAADMVIGQPNFASTTQNYGGLSASSMVFPMGGYTDGVRIFSTDSSNNRILISPIPGI